MTLLMSVIVNVAENVKTVKLSFCKQQFSFVKDEVGAMEIVSPKLVVSYGAEASQPGLPWISVNVGLPNGSIYKDVTETVTRNLLYNNIILAANPTPLPTNYEGLVSKKTLPVYKMPTYPSKTVKYVGTSTMDGYTILRFLVCPFEYDVQGKKLYIKDNVMLNISIEDSPALLSSNNECIGQNMHDVVMGQIVNADDFEEAGIMTQGLDIIGIPLESITSKYLIVTSEKLAKSFQPLADLKYLKGLKSDIITVEKIVEKYPNLDAQLAIKTYLKEQYESDRLKYVLLGGDNTVVPVRGCYGKVNDTEDKNIPTDLYYACFGKCFSWDANGNGIYGELSDSISIDPSIFVTRVPVRSCADVDAFTSKIINYELNPLEKGWSNNMLLSGATLFNSAADLKADYNDVVFKGNDFYDEYISPYWDGEKKMFYDTYTDFPGGADYDLTISNLQSQLSQGYSFIEMMTHGGYNNWGLEDWKTTPNRLYQASDASDLINSKYSIVTTMSCYTNAFDADAYDPCLSEGFIRNPNSGVVAYLGCSRYGWGYRDTSIGPSLQYDAQFYKKLFSKSIINKRFGEIVAAAKNEMASSSIWCNNTYRWVQFGLNPIGDPEMPIYTTVPQTLSNVTVTYGLERKSVTIDAGVDGCQITFLGKDSEGKKVRLIKRNVRNAKFQLDGFATICITKQNYIPCFKTVGPYSVMSNAIASCSIDKSNNKVVISTQLAENVKSAEIVVSSLQGNNAKYKLSAESPNVTADLSGLPNGVHVVSLFVEGKVVDSRNIIK